MKVQAPFGLVTGCHAGDKFLVKATLASMRHYCPTVPICLVVDGDFDVSDLQKDYGLIVLRVSELPSAEMRALIGGNFRAKLSAMWEGPFEFYVWLDSDAIVWGDFTPQVRQDVGFHIFGEELKLDNWDKVPDWVPHLYFDPELLKRFDAKFDWRRGVNFFCSGAFACRRNAIPFEQWALAESWAKQVPKLFAWGEMGMLNYVVHAMRQRGELTTSLSNLQHIWGLHGKTELEQDCRGAGWSFPKTIARPRVAHFCGRKPYLFDQKAYSRPFTIARLEHHRKHHSNLGAWRTIWGEDCGVLVKKITRRR